MDTHTLIATRRTVHQYDGRPVDPGSIRRALEAAQWAPNHKLTWPWRFVVVGPATRDTLTAIGIDLKRAANPGMADEMVAKVRAKLAKPAALVVACQVRSTDAFRQREDYASLAMAIQNMHLALWSEGIYSKWGTGGLTRHPRTYQALGIDGNTLEIVGFVWIGYPQKEPPAPTRPPLNEVVREVP